MFPWFVYFNHLLISGFVADFDCLLLPFGTSGSLRVFVVSLFNFFISYFCNCLSASLKLAFVFNLSVPYLHLDPHHFATVTVCIHQM